MRIVEAPAADMDAMVLVNRLAFDDEEVIELVRDLFEDPTALPLLSLLAEDDGRPVGHILFSAAHVQGDSREVTVVILAPLAVVPDSQRQGVGGRLIEDGIARLAATGVDLVFVLGHPEYYPRHGFEPAHPHRLVAPYPITPQEAWMVRALQPGVLGEVQGTIICAESMMKPEYWRE